MSYLTYKFLHLAGVIMVLLSLGGLLAGRFLSRADDFPWRKQLAILNGVGLLVVFVAGFGLLARLGASWPWQAWVFTKMLIWVWIGLTPALVRRSPGQAQGLWWSALAAALAAAFMAAFKPF